MRSTIRNFFALLVLACIPAAASAADLILPNHHLTPGVTSSLSKQTVCRTKWGLDARHVSAKMKADVFSAYGLSGNTDPACVPDARGRHCEIDHLVSRE